MKNQQAPQPRHPRLLASGIRVTLLALLAAVVWQLAAAESSASDDPKREAAIAELRQVLDAAETILGDKVRSYDAPVDRPMACPAAMAGKASASSSIQVKLKIDSEVEPRSLLEVMDEHWKKNGLETYFDAMSSQQPTLRTSFSGYNVALRVAETKHLAYLIGTTPCLPYDQKPVSRSPLDNKKGG